MKQLKPDERDAFNEKVRKEYCDEKKTMKQIGEELGCSAATVLYHLRQIGVETRSSSDYETSEKVREAWREIGRKSKGKKMSAETRRAMSLAKKGKRARDDYEFGGHEKKHDGYICVYMPEHPMATLEGYVMKHRLVMERELGMIIPNGYVVHHINKDRSDNRIDNLALMTFKGHAALHIIERNNRRKEK